MKRTFLGVGPVATGGTIGVAAVGLGAFDASRSTAIVGDASRSFSHQ